MFNQLGRMKPQELVLGFILLARYVPPFHRSTCVIISTSKHI